MSKNRLVKIILILSPLILLSAFLDAKMFGGNWKDYIGSSIIEVFFFDLGIIVGYKLRS